MSTTVTIGIKFSEMTKTSELTSGDLFAVSKCDTSTSAYHYHTSAITFSNLQTILLSSINNDTLNLSSDINDIIIDSANWNSTYSTVSTNSSSWGGGTDDIAVNNLVHSNSANWDGVYSTVQSTSASWGSSGTSVWTTITDGYTATPATSTTITTTSDLTDIIASGIPLRSTISGTVYYGQVTAATSALITVRGAPLIGDISKLEYGMSNLVSQIHVSIPGYFEDATNTALLNSDLGQTFMWIGPRAYCVGFSFSELVADSGSPQPNVNVRWSNLPIYTSNTNKGPLLAASVQNTTTDINTTNYIVDHAEVLEIECTKGQNGDASDLSLDIIMIVQ